MSLTFIMCSPNKNESSVERESSIGIDQIDTIFVTYFPGIVTTDKAIRCDKLGDIQKKHPRNDYSHTLSPELIDTFIVDRQVLDRIKSLIPTISYTDDFTEDARMYVTISHPSGVKDELCIDVWKTRAKYNGKPCLLSNEILFLLRNYSGYYHWIDDSYIQYFEELKDTSFVRAKTIQ